MSTKTQNEKTAQSSDKLPTQQERIASVAEQLKGIKDSVSQDELASAAKKIGISLRTGERYLNGKVGFLHRGLKLYKELSKNIMAATSIQSRLKPTDYGTSTSALTNSKPTEPYSQLQN